MLRNFDEARDFVDGQWGFETSTRPDKNLTTVIYKNSVLHNYLESEEMTLLVGNDGNYYTVQDRWARYGDYADTEYQWYGRFNDPDLVKQHLCQHMGDN